MNLILFIVTCYGISNIIIFGSIFESFRQFWKRKSPNFFGKLFSCMICLPTYVGFLISIGAQVTGLLQFSPFASVGMDVWFTIPFFNVPLFPIAVFLDGCFASGSVWLVHTLQEKLERE